jgi:glutamate-1-semialdehyde 2,1-aminomutase
MCLGDTGAMTGHSPSATVAAVQQQLARGITLMLPTEDAVWVGEELQRRFRLPYWQFALTATDANRFSIRLARQITGRSKILVFNWCYHGSVDETFITLEDGVSKPRRGNVGPPVDPSITTKVVEFNDVDALAKALQPGDVACVLAEPAMTNVGIVHPDPGYHQQLRELTRKHGTLLIIDETHTICAGPGGYTVAENLDPDILVFGKPICDVGGIGGTLAGNALSLAAMRATLEKVLTQEAFDRMIPLAERWTAGVEQAITEFDVPWHVSRLGCRAEYLFSSNRPRNGTQAHDAMDFELERFMHLYAMNRGILLTPFHNMALMSPATRQEDIDHHTKVFCEALQALVA